ncbi:MAG: hypothetical protein NVSMB49_09580 [Ktedonobacteraceae bacterium]
MYPELTTRFKNLLLLEHVPIGMAFLQEAPISVEHTTAHVPSACTFWRLAEQGVFYANGLEHKECPIGMMTMGFTMPESDQQRAMALVGTMASVKYFSHAEVAALPTVQKPHENIVYGRLDQFPIEPDVVLCRLNAQQAMLIAEALGKVDWLHGGQTAFGRPTCGVIPRTLQKNEVSMSFGCVGARTYVELTPNEMILTIPGEQFANLVEKLDTIVNANNVLAPFHAQQKATFVA